MKSISKVGAAAIFLQLLMIAPACANDITPEAIAKGFAMMAAHNPISWIVYTVFVTLIEAVAVCLILRIRYSQSFTYLLLANGVSAAFAALIYFTGGGEGWKTAIVLEHWGSVTALFIRSYLVTVAEETVVMALLFRGRFGFEKVITAVAVGNAASYLITGVLMAL